MLKKNIIKIFEIWQQNNLNPKTELNYINNYTLLVAVVLSAQTTDVNVNKATKELFKIAYSPQLMIKLGEKKLKKYISSIGLYNAKAKNVILLSKQLIEKHNSEVPNDFESLVKLAGVGRKTANVVLNCAFNQLTMGVDTHVFRIANRIGIVNEDSPEKTEISLLKKIPTNFLLHAHHWMILHGRYVCKARNPDCEKCKIIEFCEFKAKKLEG
ncbi:MAG: endonuclease III [Alphaproteobacteria bacterium]